MMLRYGEKGVDSMVELWKESKNAELPLDPAKLHSMMMAKAAANYASDVAKQAKQLELDQDPEVKAMVEKMEGSLGSNGEEVSKGDESGEVNNFAAGFLQVRLEYFIWVIKCDCETLYASRKSP